jgi:hypothetical protein
LAHEAFIVCDLFGETDDPEASQDGTKDPHLDLASPPRFHPVRHEVMGHTRTTLIDLEAP